MENRLDKFERMLLDVQKNYQNTTGRMDQLRGAGKEKSATFRQLMGDKLLYQNILSLYRIHGLLDEETK